VGEAEILTDQETKSRFWRDSFIDHYPGRETDPIYVIIKFTTKRVSFWIGNEERPEETGGSQEPFSPEAKIMSAEFNIEELLKVQSRCGLLCDGCTYKQSHGCAGCIAVAGKPFWGECDVAKCCQSKGYAHCGECAEIPCEPLREMSCGDGEHCDKPAGARIAVCKAWANNAK
jgi:hypothetical protein